MRFQLTIHSLQSNSILPLNYQYPLASAIYGILSKGDAEYAGFLHEKGYGKGFKLFTFSQLNVPFTIKGDRMELTGQEVNFQIAFHLPRAMENFVKGLFQSEEIVIADKKSRAVFTVKSIESLPNPLQAYKDNEIITVQLKPLSPIVAGIKNEQGNYDFLKPDDANFTDSLIYNWRSKIASCFVETLQCNVFTDAILLMEIVQMKQPPKSRLITIKAGTPEETKIRGWLNFGLKVTAEKRFVELLQNAGCGIYNSMGCGCVEVVEK